MEAIHIKGKTVTLNAILYSVLTVKPSCSIILIGKIEHCNILYSSKILILLSKILILLSLKAFVLSGAINNNWCVYNTISMDSKWCCLGHQFIFRFYTRYKARNFLMSRPTHQKLPGGGGGGGGGGPPRQYIHSYYY